MGPQKPELFKSISSDAACISKEDVRMLGYLVGEVFSGEIGQDDSEEDG